MSPQERDLECLLRLQSRDPSGLETLYDAYGAQLYAIVVRIVRDAAEAEDVLQEAWAQVWKSAASYDAQRGTVGAWLMTVARSRALDRYRAAASRGRALDQAETVMAPPGAAPDPAAQTEQAQLGQHMRAALAQLPGEQRQVLELAYWGGLSQSEIAAQLGRPLGTVKSWTRQGLLRLRELTPRVWN